MTLFQHSKQIRYTSGKILLVLIILFCGTLSASSQKINLKKKKQPQKEAVVKNNTVAKNTKAKTTPKSIEELYTSPCYEGDLLYRNEEIHSRFIRTMSGGMSYNGDRSVLITLCEEGMRMSDLDMHLHTVIIPEENISYVYSELLDYGYILDLDQVRELYNALDVDYNLRPDDPTFAKKGNLTEAQEMIEYSGDKCSVIRGLIEVGDAAEYETEMWIYKCRAPEAYKYFTYGYNTQGIVKKMIFNYRADLPLFGNVKSLVASELVAVEDRPVDIEELLPPESMLMKPAKDIGKLYGYYKDVNKELKKRKLKPKAKKAKEVKRNIQARWNFADDWMNVSLHSQSADDLEKQLSDSFSKVLNSFASLSSNKSTDATGSTSEKKKTETASKKESEQKDMIYIPDLIREVESSVSPFKAKVEDYDQCVAYNASHSRKKRIRIGGQYIYVSEVTGMRKPVLDKIGYSSAKSVVADARRVIDLVIQYGRNNNTDYISRERFNKINNSVHETTMSNLKRATKNARDRKLSNYKKYYSHYVSMLTSMYYFDKERDFKSIARIQNSMKKLRSECNCDKSPWEDWDGITDPTR